MTLASGEGGDDAKSFSEELFSAYLRYAKSKGYRCRLLTTDSGKQSVRVKGKGCAQTFENEAGKHIVQRYPSNGKGSRHTSAVAVAVLPLPPESEVPELKESDLEVHTQRGHGPGGQHRQKTESSVRMTHKPTGIQVFVNTGRSQGANKLEARRILAARVAQHRNAKQQASYNRKRKSQLSDQGRGGKERTYNFIRGEIKDHRSGKRTRNITAVMKGNFDLLR